MRRTLIALTLALSLTACKKTGEGEYQVKTPDIDIKPDSATLRLPEVKGGDIDVKSKPETLIINKPSVKVTPPSVKRP